MTVRKHNLDIGRNNFEDNEEKVLLYNIYFSSLRPL